MCDHSPKPDILESEVKWILGSITKNKASGGDGIPAELFEVLKMMLLKCCTQYASRFGKLSSGHGTRKGQFSFQLEEKQCQRMFLKEISPKYSSEGLMLKLKLHYFGHLM